MRKIVYSLLGILFTINLTAQTFHSNDLRQKCFVLRRFLEMNHYQPVQWNDSTSSRLFDHWLQTLDEAKLYFLQSDIKELSAYRYKLDDELAGKEWGFFDKSISICRKRLQQSDSISNALLAKPFDFTKPDVLHVPFASYPSSIQEIMQRRQQVYKWDILYDILEDEEDSTHPFTIKPPVNFNELQQKELESLRKSHAANVQDKLEPSPYFENNLADDYLDAIAWCYDPHTNYMNFSKKKEFETELSGFEYSAGIDIDKNDKSHWEITRLVPGGAAWRSGELHQGDILLKIKSGDHPEKSLDEMNDKDVIALLEGTSDDKLLITVKTKDGKQKTIALTKEKIEDDESIVQSFVIGDKTKIGYISLPDFYTDPDNEQTDKADGCANDIAKEIIKLKKDSICGLILDLRYNGGGSVWEAVQLAGIFIDIGPICSMKDKTGKTFFMKDPNRGTIYNDPLVILINSESASASELTSAALQDYHRALIVGNTSYGKGTAQIVIPMDTTGKLTERDNPTDFVKVTDRKYYRIDGNTAQWKGVTPDIVLPDFSIPDKYKEKGQLTALLPDNNKAGIYQPWPTIPVAQLQASSTARVNKDLYFSLVKKLQNLYITKSSGEENIPLQWASYFAYNEKEEEGTKEWDKKKDSAASPLKVSNNQFDVERIKLKSETAQKVNNSYIDRIADDDYIRESYNIITDWITIKK
ncbi:carboxy terminal-processing peptidase [Ferruginibacter albus]|uniref:carboxy terminal-processing peptidase n=1 Tax=Ferruginibacter albus TaxID=2875540 RepID=UPI001CC53EA6|nr:carboxy terminal-processing peptidase [Ferruginibacter albus]UAY53417.1 carboxy terminal-processing peptidase [Ferruginibacter albus]